MRAKYAVILSVLLLGIGAGLRPAYADTVGIDFSLQYRSCNLDGGGDPVNCSSWTIIDDNQAGDGSSKLGLILLSTNTDIWNVVVESGKAGKDNSPGDTTYPLANLNLSLSSSVTTGGGSGYLEVMLSQRNLMPSAPGWNLQWSPVFSGTGLSAMMAAYAAQSNNFFDESQLIQSFGPTDSQAGFSGVGPVSVMVPYSLTLDVAFKAQNAVSGAGMTGAGLLTPVSSVPEPTSLLLLGSGLISWAAWRRIGGKSRQ